MHRLLLPLILFVFVSCRSHKLHQFFEQGAIISPNPVYEEIPFELEIGLIVLEVTINDKPRKFILDTGAPNVISTELYSELSPKVILNGSVSDSQDQKQTLPFVQIDQIKIGELLFNDFGAIVADWSNIPQLECLKIDGLIGANLMRKLFWQIDYEKSIIRIAEDLSQFDFSADTMNISFTPSAQGSPHVNLVMGGEKYTGVLIDLGSNKSIEIGKTEFRLLVETNNLESIQGIGFGSTGLYGSIQDTSWQFIAPEFSIDGCAFPPQLAKASGNDTGALGNGFFQQFRTTLDWQNNRVYLAPTPEKPKYTFKSHGATFNLQDDQLVIGLIYQESPAALAGLEIGQAVLQIDQYDFQNDPFETYCQFIQNYKDIKELEILELEVLIEGQPTAIQLPRTVLLPQ